MARWYRMMGDTTRTWLIEIIAILVVVPLVILSALYVRSTIPPIEYGPVQELIPDVVRPGQSVYIARDITITRPTVLTIVRNFERHGEDGRIELYEGLDVRIAYNPGRYHQKRIFEIPEQLLPGKWSLRNRVIYEDWPAFTHMIDAAPIEFTVIPRE